MIVPIEFLGALHGHQIFRILNYTDYRYIPGLILTDATRVRISDITTYRTVMKITFHTYECLGKIDNVIFLHVKHMKS
ncbi:hypothetical protein D3C76_1515080 [compost metagenome]